MKTTSKILTALCSSALVLTSCSLFGTEITKEEAITQLETMQKTMEDKYGEIDIEKNLPVDLQYLYVEAKGYNNINGEKVNATATYFISMVETELYMISTNEEKSKDKTTKQESYIVSTEDNKLFTWDITDGVMGEVEENGLAALGLVLVYASMVTMITPEYGMEQLKSEEVEGISYTKYNESSLDIKFSTPHERDTDAVYTKEVVTISYKDNMGTKLVREGIDEDGTKNMEMTMTFQLGNKKFAKPTIPAKAA